MADQAEVAGNAGGLKLVGDDAAIQGASGGKTTPAVPVPRTKPVPPPIRYGQLIFAREISAMMPTPTGFVPVRAAAPAGTVLVVMPVGETSLDGSNPLDLDAQMDALGWVRKAPKPQLVLPSGEQVMAVKGD